MLPLPQLFSDYRARHLALPSFNIDSFEIYQAVESAVSDTKLPCLVQLSPSEDSFIQAERLLILVKKAQIDGLPIYLNYDHGGDPARLLRQIQLGFDMVHFDGSSLEHSANVTATSEFIVQAKALNPQIVVEAEFNRFGLSGQTPSPESFTDPAVAVDFIAKTSADILAVSIGNLHGLDLNIAEELDLDLFRSIAGLFPPEFFFSLHGGSGIKSEQISLAIKTGIVKININSELRFDYRKNLLLQLSEQDTAKAYEYLAPVVRSLSSLVASKLKLFSSP